MAMMQNSEFLKEPTVIPLVNALHRMANAGHAEGEVIGNMMALAISLYCGRNGARVTSDLLLGFGRTLAAEADREEEEGGDHAA